LVIFSEKKWIQLTVILSIASTVYLDASNSGNDLLRDQRTQVVVLDSVSINVLADAAPRDSNMQRAQKILAITAVVLEASIEFLPVVLAYTSDRSNECTLASLVQNVVYGSMYAFRLARNSCSTDPSTSLSNLSKVVWAANTMSSSITAFSCWRYYETLDNNYRLINMAFNGVAGAITFPSKMFARRNFFHNLWYGRI
jgi:hypothetical protein